MRIVPVNRQAVQTLLNNTVSAGGIGGGLELPKITYYIDDTVTVQQVRGLIAEGEGITATELNWIGPDDRPLLYCNRVREMIGLNFSIACTNDLLEGIRIENGAEGTGTKLQGGLTSTLNTFRNIAIRGSNKLGTGIRVKLYEPTPGVFSDNKNDWHIFDRCNITGYQYAGIVVEGTNAKNILVNDCVLDGNEIGLYAVDTVVGGAPATVGDPPLTGTYGRGGHVNILGGAMLGNMGANVRLGGRNNTFSMRNTYSEKSARMLIADHFSPGGSAGLPIIIDGNFFAVGSNLAADGEVIQCEAPLLLVRGNRFGSSNAGQQARFSWDPKGTTGNVGVFLFEGNWVVNDGDGIVFPASAPSNANYDTLNLAYRAGAVAHMGLGV